MVSAQAVLGMLLLLGASVLVRSYVHVVMQPTGMSADSVVATASYPDEYAGLPLQIDVKETLVRLRNVPGVSSAGAVKGSLVDRSVLLGATVVRGETVPAGVRLATPEHFTAWRSAPGHGRSCGR